MSLDALDHLGDRFASEPQRRHFAGYLTRPMVAQRKTVLGIHEEFAQTTDQSCLDRFLTAETVRKAGSRDEESWIPATAIERGASGTEASPREGLTLVQ